MINKQPVENIIFLHLPKAGGTTLRQVFYDQYRHLSNEEIYTINRTKETPAFVELDKTKLSEIKVLIGHFSHGIHEYLGENFTYITFLREPISRTLSQYYYSKGSVQGDVYGVINQHNYDLYGYLSNHVEPWMENAMTKHLSGCKLENFPKDCTQEMYDRALQNIKNDFTFVGLTEKFDESLLIAKKYFNWSHPLYSRKNSSPLTYNSKDIAKRERELILQLNQYDVMLYEYATERFREEWNSISNRRWKITCFRILNYLKSVTPRSAN